MNITTTVTWDTLLHAHDDELAEYRDAYQELREHAREKYDAALDDPTNDDELTAIQQQAARYEQAVQEIQRHTNALETLRDELGEGDFEIKMLSGQEALEISKEVQTDAYQNDTPPSVVETARNQLVADAATVDAPEGVPTDDEDSPVPSHLPNVLATALFEQIQRFNTAADVDFRPAGCGDADPLDPSGVSSTPNADAPLSAPSPRTDETPE
jgi:exonuclease VII small subunit